MEVKAKVKYLRMSPRKVRLAVDLIRGLSANQALNQLQFLKKDAALPVRKLLQSALANAKHNFSLEPETLYIKKISVDGGPVIHRWRPRAFGRAGAIRKRTSHINLVLETLADKTTPAKEKSRLKIQSPSTKKQTKVLPSPAIAKKQKTAKKPKALKAKAESSKAAN